MLNPFGPEREPGMSSYLNLQQRLLKNVQAANVSDQVFQVVQNAFENALNKEGVFLSRPERTKLFSQILKSVLEDMVTKLESRAKSTK